MTEFTLVRHRRYTEGADPDYEGAVEAVELGVGQASLVRSACGTVFASQQAAEFAEHLTNQRTGQQPGYFSSLRIGGAEIYVDGG